MKRRCWTSPPARSNRRRFWRCIRADFIVGMGKVDGHFVILCSTSSGRCRWTKSPPDSLGESGHQRQLSAPASTDTRTGASRRPFRRPQPPTKFPICPNLSNTLVVFPVFGRGRMILPEGTRHGAGNHFCRLRTAFACCTNTAAFIWLITSNPLLIGRLGRWLRELGWIPNADSLSACHPARRRSRASAHDRSC